jgi:uncharacterized protein YbjQ (UPF0145 family)
MESQIIVSTGDINRKYEIIGPVYFQINNRPEGFDVSTFSRYKEKYVNEINQLIDSIDINSSNLSSKDWDCTVGKWCLGQSNFELAFFIAVEELKKRAAMLGADGIIFMRQDIDLDREAYQFFYLQMYGTAVRML